MKWLLAEDYKQKEVVPPHDMAKLKEIIVNAPRQENKNDCRIFTMAHIARLCCSHEKTPPEDTFTQRDADLFRSRIMSEITQEFILPWPTDG